MKKAQNQPSNVDSLQTPCLVRFVSSPIELPAKQGTYFPNRELSKIRKLAKVAVMVQYDNEKKGFEYDLQDILADMRKPDLLKKAGLRTIRGISTNNSVSVETDYLDVTGSVSRTKARITVKVSVIQVSKPYLVENFTTAGRQYRFKIADASRLPDYKKGKSVAFKEITFFASEVTLFEPQPIFIEEVTS